MAGVKVCLIWTGQYPSWALTWKNAEYTATMLLKSDLEYVYNDEVSRSGSYHLKLGSPEQKAPVKEWQESRQKSKANQVEWPL